MLTRSNKLHFFTLLLLLGLSSAVEDYGSKQKIKESDTIKAVPVSSDNKYQHQNKRGVSDISDDIVLGSAHPGSSSSSFVTSNSYGGFSPITSAPYSLSPYNGGHLGPIYSAPIYSKPYGGVPFKAPFTATYPANGITFPKLSYANSYNGYPTASYATAHHHNSLAYPSIQYPSYQSYQSPVVGYHPGPLQSYQGVSSPVQASVTHHGVFAQAPASQVIYGNGIHKYGLAAPAVYPSSEAGNIYHQPQFSYASVQPTYTQTPVKQAFLSNYGPTVPTATIKPVVQHSQAGGAVSFASFSQQTGSAKTPIYTAPAPISYSPQYAAVAPTPQYATQPQYIVSGGYKVAAASQPSQIYAQIPYQSGAIQYGSHLVHQHQQQQPGKVTYQQVQQHQ